MMRTFKRHFVRRKAAQSKLLRPGWPHRWSVVFSLIALCSGESAAGSTADDLKDIDFLVTTVRENYAGFNEKMTPQVEPQIAAITEQLREKAGHASEVQLLHLMREWTEIFSDNRLRIVFSGALQEEFVQQGAKEAEQRPDLTDESVRSTLQIRKEQLDPIEGIWMNAAGNAEIAIVRDTPGTFIATTLKTADDHWAPGFVKAHFEASRNGAYPATLIGHSFLRYHLQAHLIAKANVLKLGGYWRRRFPESNQSIDLKLYLPEREFTLRPLNENTLLIRLPDFYENHLTDLTKLFVENADLINRTPNWVIDLRANEGGSDFVYDRLIDYLYTRPIYRIAYQYLATPENVDYLTASLQTPMLPDGAKKETQTLIARMRQHMNQLVTISDKQFSVVTRPNILNYPKKVAIIITGATGSAEKFVLDARQSRKVTLYGGNTTGALDYSNTNKIALPSGRFELYYPISRSLRLPEEPFENVGIPADIQIPETEEDPIQFVEHSLRQQ
jgi:hypothetical protein